MINLIQIGANAGLTPEKEDIIWPIIRQKRWNAIFVEPLEPVFKLLKENYSDLTNSFFENVAIMDYDGETTIYFGHDTRTASTNPNNHNKNYNNCIVPCVTLTTLVTKYNMLNKPFDMLQIDAEGADGKILISTDFTNIKPKLIRFEHVHLRTTPNRNDVIAHLNQFSYKEIPDIYDNGLPGESNIDTLMERQND